MPPTNVSVPLAGVITLPVSTDGAIPSNVVVPTLGVTTKPLTTTLGAEPINNAVPVGSKLLRHLQLLGLLLQRLDFLYQAS